MFDFHTYYYYYYGYDDSKDSATKAELIHVYDEKDATSLKQLDAAINCTWAQPCGARGDNQTTLTNL